LPDWITTQEAVELSGFHPEYIRRLVRQGKKHGSVWLPFLFALLGLIYQILNFRLISISWSISNSLVGP
jgi:hypothetical protein